MNYNWQQSDWPQFSYNIQVVEDLLYRFTEKLGRIGGILKALPEEEKTQTLINTLVSEAIKTSEIEGEYLSRKDVMSSICNNLSTNAQPEKIRDRRAKGIADLMTDVQSSYLKELDMRTLFRWHKMVFTGNKNIKTGGWRTHKDPMQVISGAIGKEKIHFEAPPSDKVPMEMEKFITWFNATAPNKAKVIKYAPIRSAIAHLYFETIHPFEDGNGRIGRAIAEKALSQTVGHPILLSISATIESHKKAYYNALKEGQRSNEITPWLVYFINTIIQAQNTTETLIDFTLKKTKLFNRYGDQLNERQTKVINRMLEEGPKGFEGGMTAKKYMRITQISKPTATRDLQKLLELNLLVVTGGGRNTSYQLNLN